MPEVSCEALKLKIDKGLYFCRTHLDNYNYKQ